MRVGAGRHPDRLLAFGAVLIAALVFALVIARSDPPKLAAPPLDPTAAPQMLALMRAGEGRNGVVTYDYTRRAAGAADRTSQVSQGQLSGTQVTRVGDALDVENATTTYHCQLVDEKPSCSKVSTTRSLAASEVFAAAIGTGAYRVTRVPDATIAGERARCFRTTSVNGQPYLSDIGTETLACFAADGVVLRKQVARPNPVDDLVATSVARNTGKAALAPLLVGFEKGTTGVGG